MDSNNHAGKQYDGVFIHYDLIILFLAIYIAVISKRWLVALKFSLSHYLKP